MPGDQFTPVTSRRLFVRLVAEPSEGSLDEEGNALVVASLRPCGSRSDSISQPSRSKRALKCVAADGAEQRRLDRLGMRLHGVEQAGRLHRIDRLVGDSADSGARTARGLQHRLLLGAAGQPAELGDELADGAVAPAICIMGRIGGDQPLEALRRIPVRRGRIGRPPLRPGRIGRRDRRSLAEPIDGERQVRVEPGSSRRRFVKIAPPRSCRIEQAKSGQWTLISVPVLQSAGSTA